MKNLIVTSLLLLAGFILLTSVFADTVTEEWVARYNGPANSFDQALAMALDTLGNVYVTGRSRGSGTNWWDYATVKYAPDGNEEWVARYNGPGNYDDIARAIAVDSSGNVYVTGFSWQGTRWDFATVKYDTDGNQLWVATYNEPGNYDDYAGAIALDRSGNVYVTGQSYGSGAWYYATVKYDTDGNEEWVARYIEPGTYDDAARAIAVDSSGNVYVTGESAGSGTSYDYATIKYDRDGNQLWVARYNGPGNSGDRAYAMALDSSGNVHVTGDSVGSSAGYDFATVKYDTDGNQLWVARYNRPGNYYPDYVRAIAVDSSGNVYVTGGGGGSGTSSDYATVKYAPDGNEEWVARYNGPGNSNDYAYAIALDNSGNVYVTGQSYGSGTYYDCATVKYDTDGNQLWVARYNGPGYYDDIAHAIAVDCSGNVYVTGRSWGSSDTSYDYATVKYSPDQITTPAEGICELIKLVESFNLQRGIENSLDAKLQNARAALVAANAGQRQDAINKMQAFINEVEAQRGKWLTDEQADALIDISNAIILLL